MIMDMFLKMCNLFLLKGKRKKELKKKKERKKKKKKKKKKEMWLYIVKQY
jgi:hypothetical protein